MDFLMRLQQKRPDVRDIFHLPKRKRTEIKRDKGRSKAPLPSSYDAAVPATSKIKPEFEYGPLQHDAGPTRTPSNTIATSNEHLGVIPLDQCSVASCQSSVPPITVVDPDGNAKLATSALASSESIPTYPQGPRRNDDETWPERTHLQSSVQGSVNLALTRALQPDGTFVSGLVDQLLTALVPVLDERIKLALDSIASKTEPSSLRGSGKLDPIPEVPERLARLHSILETTPRSSNIKPQPVEKGTPPSPTLSSVGHTLTRSPARRRSLRPKLDSPRTPLKTPLKYPGNLPTPESHRNSLGRRQVYTPENATPTRATLPGKVLSESMIESVLTVPLISANDDPSPSSNQEFSPPEINGSSASSSTEWGYDTTRDTSHISAATQSSDAPVLPAVGVQLIDAEPAVSVAEASGPRGSLLQFTGPKQGAPPHATSIAKFVPPSHEPSDGVTTAEHDVKTSEDNQLLRDPAVVGHGPHLLQQDPAILDNLMKQITGYVKALTVADVSSPSSIPPDSERREESPRELPSLQDVLKAERGECRLEWIGSGISGDVYRATPSKEPSQSFAVKLVPIYHEFRRNAAVLEARALLKIKAESKDSNGARNVLRIFSGPMAIKTGYSVSMMPYYKNTLHDYTQRLDRRSLLFVISELTKGLQFLHLNEIIHLDLKSANIFIDNDGHCVIGDFSGSYTGPVPKLVREHWSTMTPEYMAPEIARGQRYKMLDKFDGKADIWSLGVTIYLLICGSRAVKLVRGEAYADFTDYDNLGLAKDTMVTLMNLARCSETVQKLVLQMCQIKQDNRWNTTMIQTYLDERACWEWDGPSPLVAIPVAPVDTRSVSQVPGMELSEGVEPDALREDCEMYLKEVYAA